jgi:hypothetical protein
LDEKAMAFPLEDAFRQFCSFGDKDSAPLMDGAKFAKMCRDCKLLDKTKLTATDVDIIFTKAKPKTERKLTLEQFEVAVKMLGEKKYPGDPRAMSKIQSKLSSGPTTHPGTTKVAQDQLLGRMTDTSAYTGTHKQRFDESGKGRGLEGRDSVPKGLGYHAPLVSAQPSYVTGNLIGLDAVDSAREQEKAKSRAAQSSPRSGGSKATAKSSPRPSGSKTAATSSPRVQSKVASSSAKASPKPPAQSKAKSTVATSSPKASPKAKPKI